MKRNIVVIISVLIAIVSLSLLAANKYDSHSSTMSHGADHSSGSSPKEGGQAQFSALIEIVALLEDDDNTDWTKVNIDGLRTHLLDMDLLVRDTNAKTSVVSENQIQFDVIGNSESIPAIHRMTAAHAKFIEQSRGWEISSAMNENGASIKITVDDLSLMSQLSALGFYGFMSLDSHHQAHHYQMALGKSH